ncbi:MAG TPA: 7TM diverse intracellular signaling domain-containing protein [Bacteroidia bacterium]
MKKIILLLIAVMLNEVKHLRFFASLRMTTLLLLISICLTSQVCYAQTATLSLSKGDSIEATKPACKPFVITSDTLKKYDISPFIQFIADTANQYSIEQVSSLGFANKFTAHPLIAKVGAVYVDTTNNKLKSKTFWLRFTIKSNLNYDKEWLLSIQGNSDDISLVYIPDGTGKFSIKKTGNIPLKERDFKHSGRGINYLIRGGQEQTIYVKSTSDKKVSLRANAELETKDVVLEVMVSKRLIGGIFLGIFLIMVIYNSILYVSIKERSYLYYILYIFFFAVFFMLCATGYGFEFLWSNHPDWTIYITPITGFFFLFFYVLFGKTYLNTKKYLTKWNKVIGIQLIGLPVTVAILPLMILYGDSLPDWLSGTIGITMGVFTVSSFIILLIPAILCIRKGVSHAKYFLLGNIMVIFGIGLTIYGGIASISFLGGNGLLIGVVLEIIMFSVGIGAKVNGLTKDKVKAQGETIAQLEENEKLKDKVNRELEQKVSERTAEVVKQKEIVEAHQKEIIDSITYAKRLQQAILPTIAAVQEQLPNSFIYYQPKDIVAGDFYWMHTTKEAVYIAAADCTGHGVPGAMVSVVCSNALNRAVKEFNLTDTGLILDKTRELVIETFEKSDKDVKDGMDISLLRIEYPVSPFEGGKGDVEVRLQWSGANNSLWYILNNELIEVKADKQPIGKYSEAKPFTTNNLSLSSPVSFYLFSDGYADQFSPDDKKLMKKKFKDIVLSIQNLSMQEQGKHLDRFHIDWKGIMEQTDDVLVIGVKI